jgi:hypothetical protein
LGKIYHLPVKVKSGISLLKRLLTVGIMSSLYPPVYEQDKQASFQCISPKGQK